MPAKSAKQQRFMGMLVGNPRMRKEKGVSLSVAEEFARKPSSDRAPKAARTSTEGFRRGRGK